MKKRIIAVSLTVAMLSTLGGTVAHAEETEIVDQIYVSLQNQTGYEEGWTAVAEAYKAYHPEIEIVIDLKAQDGYTTWASNCLSDPSVVHADIIEQAGVQAPSKRSFVNYWDYMENESPYSDGLWMDQLDMSNQQPTVYEGETYLETLHYNSAQVVWLYNADIFDEVGVTAPTTWDELVAVCEKLYEAGYQPITIDGDANAFYGGRFAWLERVYTDQTMRDWIVVNRAQEGDYCYDPEVDGVWEYDPTDPYNDSSLKVNTNVVRLCKAIDDGTFTLNEPGYKAVWEQFARVFPKYAGGDNLWGTEPQVCNSLFYKQEAAMMLGLGFDIVGFYRDMKIISEGGSVELAGDTLEGIETFELGAFNMPSMEGEEFLAPARTVGGANGFLSVIQKDDQNHTDNVMDFLMFYTSQEGMSAFIEAAIPAGYTPGGASLVYGVSYPEEIEKALNAVPPIGWHGGGSNQIMVNGMNSTAALTAEHYDINYKFLRGEITVDEHAEMQQAHWDSDWDNFRNTVLGVSEADMENPQNAPTGL